MTEKLDFDARYSVSDYPGIAFYLVRYDTYEVWPEPELICGEDHDHDEYCFAYPEEPDEFENTDKVIAIMVGDDRRHLIDVSELTKLSDDDYCSGCGQIGCKAYGE